MLARWPEKVIWRCAFTGVVNADCRKPIFTSRDVVVVKMKGFGLPNTPKVLQDRDENVSEIQAVERVGGSLFARDDKPLEQQAADVAIRKSLRLLFVTHGRGAKSKGASLGHELGGDCSPKRVL